ncbi:MAG: hypothetical protein GEU92_17850 [Alphaproteobacteria bacterium]|nr:hypothetical protein [Alphaproteobacteria bacterium]
MSGATEIYICQPGQPLKEGRVEYGTMETRDEAASDAARRCTADPSIGCIAYYAVDAKGGFRNFYTHENPKAGKPKSPRPAAVAAAKPGKRPARLAPTLLQRVRELFEED